MERLPRAVAKVSVTIDPADVSQAMDRAFKTVVGRYNIPGFRRGKAPRKIFERYVGRGVLLQEAAQQLVDRHYREALQAAAVEPVGEPRINIVALDEDKPFQFDIEVESKPVIEIGSLDDLLNEPLVVPEPTDEDLQKEFESVAISQAQLVPVEDEPAAMGDRVVLNLKGYLEEGEEADQTEPFVEDETYAVEIGSGMAVEGLETQLIGLKPNEPATLHLTYPENHPDVALKGKPVRFEVTITELKRPDVPPIDEELAKTLGYDNEQEFRDTVANRLRDRLQQQAKNDRLASILGKLKERVSFELPSALVEQAIHNQMHELDNMLRRMGADIEEYIESRQITLEDLHEEMRPQAEERVREELLLEAVARQQNITVGDEDVIENIRPMAELYRQPVEEIVEMFRSRGDFEALRESLLIQKASDYVSSTVIEG
nr:trigger factor [Sulfobacillus harzensis]